MRLLAVLTLAVCLYGGQGLVIEEADRFSATTGLGTMTASTTLCIEGRIHDWSSLAAAGSQMVSLTGMVVSHLTTNTIRFNAPYDSSASGTAFDRAVSAGRDYVFRWCRKPSESLMTLETWDGNGTVIESLSRTMTGFGTGISLGTLAIGKDGGETGRWTGAFSFLRVYTSAPSASDHPPHGAYRAGAALRYEFEGGITDTSGNGRNLSVVAGAASYQTTPAYAPHCDTGSVQVFRAGETATLDGDGSYPLDEGGTLTYLWQQRSGAGSVRWTSTRRTANPALNGTIFGQYVFRLAVTDASGTTSTCDITHGSVASDSTGSVVISNASHAAVLGNLPRYGVGAWSWLDTQQKLYLDWLANNLSTYYVPWWETTSAGTVTFSSDNRTLTGTGTNFQGTVCGEGDTVPILGASAPSVAVRYPYKAGSAYEGDYGWVLLPVYECPSDTELKMGRSVADTVIFPAASDWMDKESAMQWTLVDSTEYERWNFGSRPLNYYDQVMALYAMYYRTGLTAYLTAARTLGSRWLEQPSVSRGALYDGNMGWWSFPGRSLAMAGMMLRATDTDSQTYDPWPGIRRIVSYLNTNYTPITSSSPILETGDGREMGYTMKFTGMQAVLDSTTRTANISKLVTALSDRWTPLRQTQNSGNYWTQRATANYSFGSYNATLTGTASVTNGSATVTGTGTNFTTSTACVANNYIVFYPSDATEAHTASGANSGDSVGYKISSATDTSITLTRAYEGTTGTGKKYGCGAGAIGQHSQPFMEGIRAQGFLWAARALDLDATKTTEAALYRTYAQGVGTWLRSRRVSGDGIWYSLISPSCEIADASTEYCQSADADARRINLAESAYAVALEYELAGTAQAATDLDSWYTTWFTSGGASRLPLDGYMYATTNPNDIGKWLGFFFGIGRTWAWPSARLGGLAAASSVSRSVSVRIADVANATQVRFTPVTGSPVTCSSMPCEVTIDSRRGTDRTAVEYLSGGGATLRRGSLLLN